MTSDRYELVVVVEGELRDADGNLLDTDGNPAPDEPEQESKES
jgi:hypothetical protein